MKRSGAQRRGVSDAHADDEMHHNPPETPSTKNSHPVAASSRSRNSIAYRWLKPHISSVGRKLAQTAGRSGRPKIAQRMSGSNWTHLVPAGLPSGIPGIGEEILGAIQHAPQ